MRRRSLGFTLTELAVVVTIVGLLLASLLYTLSAQTEQRDFEDTRQRLERARDLLLAYVVVNGRLPCPARSTSSGAEVRVSSTGQCSDGTNEDYYGGTVGGATAGLLPAVTIGYQQVDSSGFALDAWGNRIRYAVAKTITNCTGTSATPHFTNAANLKANGLSCQPGDLLVCKSSTGITSSSCGASTNQLTAANLVAALVFSTGKNGTTGGTGNDEAANLNGAGNADPVFVWHTPTDTSNANGEFDDQLTWITAGELYSRMINAGILP